MIDKPEAIRFNAMTTGLAAMFAALLLLPPSAVAAGDVHPVMRPMTSRMAPAHAHASRAAYPDPRVTQFNLELAAYKRTVAALQRDTQRLEAQQQRLDAIIKDLSSGAQLDMIHLQSYMSARQTAVQLSTNIIKSLSDSADAIAGNTGK
jgi:uncharacterized protein (DUF3084 family)